MEWRSARDSRTIPCCPKNSRGDQSKQVFLNYSTISTLRAREGEEGSVEGENPGRIWENIFASLTTLYKHVTREKAPKRIEPLECRDEMFRKHDVPVFS